MEDKRKEESRLITFIKNLVKHKLIIIFLVIFIGVASSKILKPDNVVEELSETYIKKELGIDIDLSPESPEPKKA